MIVFNSASRWPCHIFSECGDTDHIPYTVTHTPLFWMPYVADTLKTLHKHIAEHRKANIPRLSIQTSWIRQPRNVNKVWLNSLCYKPRWRIELPRISEQYVDVDGGWSHQRLSLSTWLGSYIYMMNGKWGWIPLSITWRPTQHARIVNIGSATTDLFFKRQKCPLVGGMGLISVKWCLCL